MSPGGNGLVELPTDRQQSLQVVFHPANPFIVILHCSLICYITIWIIYLYSYQDDDISHKTSQTGKPQSVRLPFPAKQPTGHQPQPAG